jgi:2-oxo-3-hexenedioate decarboxylase
VVSTIDHRQIAKDLELARENVTTIEPASRANPSFSFEDAYEVGRHIATIRQVSGSAVSGFKIGLTYLPTWERIGIDAPFWAPVYSEGVERSGSLAVAGLASPRLEAEVIVGIRSPLVRSATVDDIESAIDWMALGFEIVDSHYPGWNASPPDLVADNGCHAGVRLGDQIGFDGRNPTELRDLCVELWCDSDLVATGRGTDVLGGPLESIARCLALPNAPRVGPGDIITTGSLTGRSHPVAAGQQWRIVPTGTSPFTPLELSVR